MKRSLCIRRGALGDTVLMIPVLRAMRAAAPDAELDFAGNLDFAGLLQARGVVDRAFSTEALQLWSPPRARERLAAYDWIVTETPLELDARLGRVVHHFDPRIPDDVGVPAATVLLTRLAAGLRVVPAVDSVPAFGGKRLKPDTRRVVLHPGSGAQRKCWPAAQWAELAVALAGKGLRVAVALGPTERERMPVSPLTGVELFDCLPLVDLAQRLETAACFVGNDSGVTHLAAALRVPTVAVFGPSEPSVWAPAGEHVAVVGARTDGPPDVAVEVVLRAVEAAV